MPNDLGYLISDNPKRSLDEGGTEDIFSFSAFVDTFKGIVTNKNNQTPFTIAIDGKWGTGKTSMMEMTRAALDKERDEFSKFKDKDKIEFAKQKRICKTFWFNAWKYSSEEHILAALLLEMFKELEKDSNFWDAIKTKINFKDVASGILGKLTSAVSSKDVDNYFHELKVSKKASFLDEFTGLMRMLLGHFCEKREEWEPEGVFVVFIDDLDRCKPDKVLQVLESVKLFLNEPGCIFFLGMEMEQVKAAVTKGYQDTGGKFEANRYLEKIFQIHVKIPPSDSSNMGKLFDQLMAQIEYPIGKAHYADTRAVFVNAGFKTQRALKRALNEYLFMESLINKLPSMEFSDG